MLGTDVGVAVTGVAGPDRQEGQEPVGTVFVGIDLGPLGGEAGPEAFHVPLFGNRLQIRQFTVITALSALRPASSPRDPEPVGSLRRRRHGGGRVAGAGPAPVRARRGRPARAGGGSTRGCSPAHVVGESGPRGLV